MPVDGVNNTANTSTNTANGVKREVSKDLDKDAFLKLLIAQLANQDPLNPMEDREFIAQLAQFSSLEQMTNMTKTLEGMADLNQYSAVSYVGKVIAFQAKDADGNMKEVIDQVLAVFFDPDEGVLLETSSYGMIPLNEIEGVTIAVSG